jgi:hypothetical protein
MCELEPTIVTVTITALITGPLFKYLTTRVAATSPRKHIRLNGKMLFFGDVADQSGEVQTAESRGPTCECNVEIP